MSTGENLYNETVLMVISQQHFCLFALLGADQQAWNCSYLQWSHSLSGSVSQTDKHFLHNQSSDVLTEKHV